MFFTLVSESTREKKKRSYKLLCWILADPKFFNTKIIHQNATWGRRCDKLLIISSKGRNHIATKARQAWEYIHKNYINQYDFFIKTDPHTYLVVENLKEFLSDKNPNETHFYGHILTRHRKSKWKLVAGGPGILLTRASLTKLVTKAFVKHPNCIRDGERKYKMFCLELRQIPTIDD